MHQYFKPRQNYEKQLGQLLCGLFINTIYSRRDEAILWTSKNDLKLNLVQTKQSMCLERFGKLFIIAVLRLICVGYLYSSLRQCNGFVFFLVFVFLQILGGGIDYVAIERAPGNDRQQFTLPSRKEVRSGEPVSILFRGRFDQTPIDSSECAAINRREGTATSGK